MAEQNTEASTPRPQSHPQSHPRPRSPHMTIYKWPITMVTSIVHRITGVGLALGGLMLACWLVALALGPESYAKVQAFHGHFIGRILLFGFTWALIFHLLNGIRHLAWDAGHGFETETANRTGRFVIVGSAVLTLGVWFLAYQARM